MKNTRWFLRVLLCMVFVGAVAATTRAPVPMVKAQERASPSWAASKNDVDIFDAQTAKTDTEISCHLGPLAAERSEALIPICQLPATLSYDRGNFAVRRALAAEIKRYSNDDLDYLVVFTDFDFAKGGSTAFITRQKNAIQGLGQPIFGNQDERLLGVVDMGNINRLDLSQGSPEERTYLNVLAHEVMHAFGVYIRPDVLRGQTDSHWSFFADSDASVMYGARWRPQGPLYLAEDILHRYSPLDMYLAGFYQASEVPPIAVINGGTGAATDLPVLGYRTPGTLQYITIEQIVAENGPRIPSAAQAQKRYRAGLVLLSRAAPDTVSSTLPATLVGFAGQFEQRFSAMTSGRGVFEFGYQRAQAVQAVAQTNPLPLESAPADVIAKAALWLSRDSIGHSTQSMAASVLLFRESGLLPQTLAAFSAQLAQSTPKNLDEAVWLLRVDPTHAAALSYLQQAADGSGGFALNHFYRASPLDTSLALSVLPDNLASIRAQALDFLSRSGLPANTPQAYPLIEGGPGRISSTAQALYALQRSGRPIPVGVPNWLAARQVDALTPAGLALPVGAYVEMLPELEQLPASEGASAARFQMLDSVHMLGTQLDPSADSYVRRLQRSVDQNGNINGSFDASPYLTAMAARALLLSQSINVKIAGAIRVRPAQAIDGDLISLSATVLNDSNSAVPRSFKAQWYDGPVGSGEMIGPAQELAPLQANEQVEISVNFDSRGKSGARTFTLVLDSENVLIERTKADNVGALALNIATVPELPDLVPEAIVLNPAAISAYPANVEIGGVLRNRGGAAVANASVVLAARTSAGSAELQRISLNAPAQSNTPFRFTRTFNPQDERRLVIRVDPENTVAEFSEANNDAPFTLTELGNSDVEVLASDITVTPSTLIAGDIASFNVTIRNNGISATPSLRAQASINACKAPQAGDSVQSIQLPAGGSVSRPFSLRVPSAGSFFVCAEIDALNELAESNENNNEARANFTATAPTQANLSFVVGSIAIEPSPALEAGNLQTSITLINYGAAVTSPFEVALYKGDPASGGTLLHTSVINAIGAGASQAVSVALTNLQARGATSLYFKVDPQNQIIERDEEDNVLLKEFLVLALPDLAVNTAGIRLQPSVPIVGQPVRATVTLSNLGGQSARNVEVAVFQNAQASGAPAASTQTVAELVAGARVDLNFDWIFEAPNGNAAVSVLADASERVSEVSEVNNLAALNLLSQSGNQLATEPVFSPNGDGIKDTTSLIFRLSEARTVDLRIVKNLTGREVRRFTGAALSNQQTIELLWDGKGDDGFLASDGQYRAVLVDRTTLESLGVVLIDLDTNRSPLLEAVDTPYAQTVPYQGLRNNAALVPPSSSPASNMVFESRQRELAGKVYPEIIRRHASTGDIGIALSAEWFRRTAGELGWSFSSGTSADAIVRYILSASGHELWISVQQRASSGFTAQYRVFALPADGFDNVRNIGGNYANAGLVNANQLAVLDDQTLAIFAPGSGYLLALNSAQISSFPALPEYATVTAGELGVLYRTFVPFGAESEIGFLPRDGQAPYTLALSSRARSAYSANKRFVLINHAQCAEQCNVELIDLLERRVRVLGGAQEFAAFVKRDSEIVVSDVTAGTLKHFALDGQLIRLQPLAQPELNWNLVEGLGPNFETKRNDIPCLLGMAARGIVSPSGQRLMLRSYQRLRLDLQPCAAAPDQSNTGEGLSRISEYRLRSNSYVVGRSYSNWYVQDPTGLAYAPTGISPPAYAEGETFEPDGSFFTDETVTLANPATQISSTNLGLMPQFVQLDLDAPAIPVAGVTPKFPLWPDTTRALDTVDRQRPFATQASIFSTLKNLTVSLRAEPTPLGVKLSGYATDGNFSYFDLDVAPDQPPYLWSAVLPRSAQENFGTPFYTYTAPAPGRYIFRLTAMDKAGNSQTHYARASTEAPPNAIQMVDFDDSAFSPNGDGVKDEFHVRFEVQRQTVETLEVFNSANALVASQSLVYTASQLGSKDLRINALELLPDGRYTVTLAGLSTSVTVDRVAPTLGALRWQDFGLLNYVIEPDDYEFVALEKSRIGTTDWTAIASHPGAISAPRQTSLSLAPNEFEDQQFRLRLLDTAGNSAESTFIRGRAGLKLLALTHPDITGYAALQTDPARIFLHPSAFPDAALSLHFDEFSRTRMRDYIVDIAPYVNGQTLANTQWTSTPVPVPDASALGLEGVRVLKLPLVPVDPSLQKVAVRIRAKTAAGDEVASHPFAALIRPMSEPMDLHDPSSGLGAELAEIQADLNALFGLLPPDTNYFFTKLASESISTLRLSTRGYGAIDALSPSYAPVYQKNGIAVFRIQAARYASCVPYTPFRHSYKYLQLTARLNGRPIGVERGSLLGNPVIGALNALREPSESCPAPLSAFAKLAHEQCTGDSKHSLQLTIQCSARPLTITGYRLFVRAGLASYPVAEITTSKTCSAPTQQFVEPTVNFDTSSWPEGIYRPELEIQTSEGPVQFDNLLGGGSAPYGSTPNDSEIVVNNELPVLRLDTPQAGAKLCLRTQTGSIRAFDFLGEAAAPRNGAFLNVDYLENSDVRPVRIETTLAKFPGTLNVSTLATIDGPQQINFKLDNGARSVCTTREFEFDGKAKVKYVEGNKTFIVPPRNLALSYAGHPEFRQVQLHHLAEEATQRKSWIRPATIGADGGVLVTGAGTQIASASMLAGDFTLDWDGKVAGAPLADGLYVYDSEFSDECFNRIHSMPVIEIDSTAPLITMIAPVPSSTIQASTATPIRVSVSDPRAKDWTLTHVNAPGGAALIYGSATFLQPSIWNTINLTGAQQLQLRAVDQLGNESVLDFSVTITPAAAPVLESFIAEPALISPNADAVLDSTKLSLKLRQPALVTLEAINAAAVVVHTFVNNQSNPAGLLQINWNGAAGSGNVPLPDGVYTLKLSVTPSAGGAPERAELTVSIDTAAPSVEIIRPAAQVGVIAASGFIRARFADAHFERALGELIAPGANLTTLAMDDITQAGEYSLFDLQPLAEGRAQLRINARDRAGNRSLIERSVEIDRSPPTAELDTPTIAAVVGVSIAPIAITGTADDRHFKRLSVTLQSAENAPSTTLYSATSAVQGGSIFNWTPSVPDGSYLLSLQAEDLADQISRDTHVIQVDNTPPVVSITAPEAGATIGSQLSLEGVVADAHLLNYRAAIANLADAANGTWTELYSSTSLPANSAPLANVALALPDGEYRLRLSAEDVLGQKSQAFVQIKLDAQAPPAPINLTASIVQQTHVDLRWNAVNAPDLLGYRIYRDGVSIQPAPIIGTSFRDLNVPERSVRYQVHALDQGGNESAPSNTAEVSLDRTPPETAVINPRTAARLRGVVSVTGTAASTQDDFREYRLKIVPTAPASSTQTLIQSALPIRAGEMAQFDSAQFANETQLTLRVEAEDIYGNTAASEVSVTVDNLAPAAPVDLLVNAACGAPAALSWTAQTGADLLGYLLYRDGALVNAAGPLPVDLRPFALQTNAYADENLGDGAHVYRLYAMDQAGNVSANSAVANATRNCGPPDLRILSPIDGQEFETSVRILADSTDLDIASVQFSYRKLGETDWNAIGAPVTSMPYAVQWTPDALSYGSYHVRALATDSAGLSDPTPPSIRIRYADLTAPAPVLGLTALVDADQIQLSWAASSASDLAEYRLLENGIFLTSVGVAAGARYTVVDAVDGAYQFQVVAVDTSGNISALSTIATAQVFAPLISAPYTPTSVSQARVQGRSPRPQTAELLRGASVVATSPVAADGRFEFALIQPRGLSPYSVRITDAQGNISKEARFDLGFDQNPRVPLGLAVNAEGNSVRASWTANTEDNILGYRLFRNGAPVLADRAPTDLSAFDRFDAPVNQVLDNDPSSFFELPYADVAPYTNADYLELRLAQQQIITALHLHFTDEFTRAVGFDVYARFEAQDVLIASVENNLERDVVLRLDAPYRTDRLRIVPTAVSFQAPFAVQISEASVRVRPLLAATQFTEVLQDGRYDFELSALNSFAFESARSAPVRLDLGDVTPPAAVELTGALSGSNVALSWSTSGSADVRFYDLYRDDIKLARINHPSLSYTDLALRDGSYRYVVRALDQFENASPASNEVSFVITAPPVAKPEQLQVLALPGGNALDVSWRAGPGISPAYYKIRRSVNAAGPFAVIASQSAVLLAERGLSNGTTYWYTVEAFDVNGNGSGQTNPVSGTPRTTQAPASGEFLAPTIAGKPLTTRAEQLWLGGYASPGLRVDIARNTGFLARTRAAADLTVRRRSDIEVSALSPVGPWALDASRNVLLNLVDDSRRSVPIGSGAFSLDGSYLYLIDPADLTATKAKRIDVRTLLVSEIELGLHDLRGLWPIPGSANESAEERWIVAGVQGSGASAVDGLWVVDMAASAAPRRVGGVAGSAVVLDTLTLSPDGRYAAYFIGDTLFVLHLQSGQVVSVGVSKRIEAPSFSADAAELLYTQSDAGSARIMAHNLATGLSAVWFEEPGSNLTHPRFDRTGSRVLLSVEAAGTQRALLLAYPSKAVLRDLELADPGALLWDGTGRWLQAASSSLTPPGWFGLDAVALTPGFNGFSAVVLDESGNASSPAPAIVVNSLAAQSGQIDLAIGAADVRFLPPAGLPGSNFAASVSVRNIGNRASPASSVALELRKPSGLVQARINGNVPALEPGAIHTLTIALGALGESGEYRLGAEVDPQALILESSETNNSGAANALVTANLQASVSITADKQLFAPFEVPTAKLRVLNPAPSFRGKVQVDVLDQAGNLIRALAPVVVPQLGFGGSFNATVRFEEPNVFAGTYQFKATLLDAQNDFVAASVGSFGIELLQNVAVSVSTTQNTYGRNETLRASAAVRYTSGNVNIENAELLIRVVNAQNATVSNLSRSLGSLLPGFQGAVNLSWPINNAPAGVYLITAELRGSQLSVGSQRSVNVIEAQAPAQLLLGELALSVNPMGITQASTATGTVRNAGSASIAPLTARLRLLRTGALSQLSEQLLSAVTPAGNSLSVPMDLGALNLPLGSYLLVLEARYPADPVNQWRNLASQSLSVLDLLPPEIRLIKPSKALPNRLPLVVSAQIVDRHSRVERAEFSIDDAAWQPLGSSPNGDFAAEVAGLADGAHQIRLRASDVFGNLSESPGSAFLVDSSPPVITITGVLNGEISNTALTPIWSVTDNDLASAQATLNGAPFVSGSSVGDDNSYTLVVTGVDRAGNMARRSVQFVIETTPPTIAFISPQDGATINAPDTAATLRSEPHSSVTLTRGAYSATALTNDFGEVSFASVPLDFGANTLTAVARDRAGNSSAPVAIQLIRPSGAEISGSLTASAPSYSIGTAVDLSYSVANGTSTAIGALPMRLRLYRAGVSTPLAERSFSAAISPGGTITGVENFLGSLFSISAHTAALEAQIDGSWRLLADTSFNVVDATAPGLVVVVPSLNAVLGASARLTVQASDLESAVERVEYQIDGGAWIDFGAPSGSNNYGSGALDAITEGPHQFRARARNAAALTSQSGEIAFAMDRNAPAISISGVADGGLYNNAVRPGIVISDSHSTVDTIRLNGGVFVPGTEISAEGAYVLSVSSVDVAGNASSLTVRFSIDRTLPSLLFSYPQAGAVLSVDHTRVDGRTEALAAVRLEFDGGVYQTSADAAGNFTIADVGALVEGENVLSARATDGAGNIGPLVSLRVLYRANANANLAGTLSGFNQAIPQDVNIDAAYQLRNLGSSTIRNVPLRIELNRVGTPGVLETQSFSISELLPAAFSSGVRRFAGRPPGSYALVFSAQLVAANGDLIWTVLDTQGFSVSDAAAPIVTILSPAADSYQRSEFSARVRATDNVAPVRVEARIAENAWVELAPVIGQPSIFAGTLSHNLEEITSLSARALDAAGNISEFALQAQRIDLNPPVLAISNISANAVFATAITPAIVVSDFSPTTRTLLLNGQPYSGAAITADGDYSLQINAGDSVGYSSVLTRQFRIDRTPPSIQISYPPPGLTTQLGSIRIAGSTDAKTAVTLRNGTTSLLLQSDANGGFALEDMALTIGSNTITAQAQDSVGNLSNIASVSVLRQGFVGAALSGRLDPIAAQIAHGQAIALRAQLINIGSLDLINEPLRWIARDSRSQKTLVELPVLLTLASGVARVENLSMPTASWPLGQVEIALETQLSQLGRAGAGIAPIWRALDRVGTEVVDREPPEARLTEPAANALVAIGDMLRVKATDRLSAIAKVEIALDGGKFMPMSPRAGFADEFELALIDTTPGAHQLTVRATDLYLNSVQSEAIPIRVREVLGLTILFPAEGQLLTQANTYVEGNTKAGATLRLSVADRLYLGSADAEGRYRINGVILDPGENVLSLVATDKQGNSSATVQRRVRVAASLNLPVPLSLAGLLTLLAALLITGILGMRARAQGLQ